VPGIGHRQLRGGNGFDPRCSLALPARRKKLRNQALRDDAPKRLDRWPWLDETTAPWASLYCVRCFEQVVEKKDSAAIDRFYDPSFVMSSNGITQDYESSAFGFT
jgi:hypothetical protein